jgi:hypothetical protein
MKFMIRDHASSEGRGPSRRVRLLPALLCAIGVLSALRAANVRGAAADQVPVPATGSARRHVAHNQKEELYFERRYGIGQLSVHAVAAGASLEFRCRVLDPEKANALTDKRAAPVMIDRKTGKKLSVPAADAKPHQSAAPETGQEYSVVFGNRDKIVKPGNMVDVVVGTVRMSGLIVE